MLNGPKSLSNTGAVSSKSITCTYMNAETREKMLMSFCNIGHYWKILLHKQNFEEDMFDTEYLSIMLL